MNLFKQLIKNRFGLNLDQKRVAVLQTLVEKRLQATNLGYHAYIHQLQGERSHPEWDALADSLTIRETFFFRNKLQFLFLSDHIIPELTRKPGMWGWGSSDSTRPKIRILSAGCSTGEEPYSIAITLMNAIKYYRNWDIRIDAFDICGDRVKQAMKGCYYDAIDRLKSSVKAMNPDYLNRYFEPPVHGSRKIKKEVKTLVHFKKNNLKYMLNYSKLLLQKYDVIFCRNVLIYLTSEDQANVVRMLENSLEPGGYLMTGDAEALHLYQHKMRLVSSNSGLIYQKIGEMEDAR